MKFLSSYTFSDILLALGVFFFLILPILATVIELLYFWIILPASAALSSGKNKRKEQQLLKQYPYVKQNSVLLKELISLNAKYPFAEIKPQYTYPYICKSSQEFQKFNFYNYFCSLSYRHAKDFRAYAVAAKNNDGMFQAYISQYDNIVSRVNTQGLSEEYRDAELRLLQENKLAPVVDTSIVIALEYRSPKGRNHLRKSATFEISRVEQAIQEKRTEYNTRSAYKATVEHERALMTPKLRWQILERDHHRCVICGATANDGVKLHVDHIKPVSKGGKTEPSNLRVLCERCNLGKGDSF